MILLGCNTQFHDYLYSIQGFIARYNVMSKGSVMAQVNIV